MLKYSLRRLAYAVPTVLGVATVAFLLIHLVPGDPARAALGPRAPEAAVRALDHKFGVDRPLLTQYWHSLRSAVTLNFGSSIRYKVSVASLIRSRIVPTALVIAYGMAVAVLLAVPLAVTAAVRSDRFADHAIRLGGMVIFVMPTFWVGLLLALVFGLELRWLPTSGYGQGAGGVLRSLTLPAIALGLAYAPIIQRTLRASLIATLSSDFVEAARARGLSERRVLYRYALRNSLASTLTVIGLLVGLLVGASVLIENVFAIQGLGSLLVDAVSSRDFPVIQGLIMLIGTVVVLVNLLTDLGYAIVDPRVRL